MDPLAEKYYSISPYVYCAGNPVNIVDPEGMDIWELQRNGNIIWKKESSKSLLLALDKNGETINKALKLEDDSVLGELSLNGEDNISEATMNSSKYATALQLFFFLSDNSDVEWVMHVGNNDVLKIGTFHLEESVGNWEGFGFKERPKESIHSHPNINPLMELQSIGFEPELGADEKTYRAWLNSDWWKMKNTPEKLAPNYMIYFPQSHNVYRLFNDSDNYGVSKPYNRKHL